MTPHVALEAELVEAFANDHLNGAEGGFSAPSDDSPAMATPAIVYGAQMVIQGSTICLIC